MCLGSKYFLAFYQQINAHTPPQVGVAAAEGLSGRDSPARRAAMTPADAAQPPAKEVPTHLHRGPDNQPVALWDNPDNPDRGRIIRITRITSL